MLFFLFPVARGGKGVFGTSPPTRCKGKKKYRISVENNMKSSKRPLACPAVFILLLPSASCLPLSDLPGISTVPARFSAVFAPLLLRFRSAPIEAEHERRWSGEITIRKGGGEYLKEVGRGRGIFC